MTEREIILKINKLKKELFALWEGTHGALTEKDATIMRLGEAAYWLTEVVKFNKQKDVLNQKEY